jgi:hypothetical protein
MSDRINGKIFVGTMYLPDGNIRPVYKSKNPGFLPPTWICAVDWDGHDGKKIYAMIRYNDGEMTDKQLIKAMTMYLDSEWDYIIKKQKDAQ